MKRLPFLCAAIISALVISLIPASNQISAAPILLAGFVTEPVVTGLTGPTTITWAPDGRMFIGQKDGRVRVFQNGAILSADFINISSQVNNYWDRGLLGIAVHPDFPNTPYVYLLFTYDPPSAEDNGSGARVSRLLRITADPDNTNVALPGSEVVLLGNNSTFQNIGDPNGTSGPPSCDNGGVPVQDCLAADSPTHTIGAVVFGTDGSLFVSNGEGAHYNYVDSRALRAQNLDSLGGKILRLNPITGQGYSDNPFYDGNPNSNRSKVYSLGLRNPFRMTIHPASNEPYVGDVGWSTWEEINSGRGKNFGWPCYEGRDNSSAQQGSYASLSECQVLYAQGLNVVQKPAYAYNHSESLGGSSVQAGSFYDGTVYPAEYQGALFLSDYNTDWIRYLTFDPNTGQATVHDFGTDVSPMGGVVQIASGPDKNLYYVVYNGPTPDTSEVRRIRYTAGGNTPPAADAAASPDAGQAPLTVNFSSANTYDPDAQTLTYAWDFGDGGDSTEANPTHTYTANGNYAAALTVTDSSGAAGADTVLVTVGNTRPTATITSPANGAAYNASDTINFSGAGADPEDGVLSGASLRWDVLLHHNQHVHFDYAPGLTGNTGSFTAPDHGDNSWMELCLTATDGAGLTDQKCVSLLPNTVVLTFDTVPSGLLLSYEGATYRAPFNANAVVNSHQDFIAATSQGCYPFSSWSDGGAASHQVVIGNTSQTYVAAYATSLPSPWQTSDVGSVGAPGSGCYNNGTYTLTGSGVDIWQTADGFRYVYQPLSGDGEIIARIASVGATNAWAKAGVMIRETLLAGSRNALLAMTYSKGVTFQRRAAGEGSSVSTAGAVVAAPYWLRLTRAGDTFNAYQSPDGVNWTLVGADTISMAADVYIGLAVTSHNDGIVNWSTFTNVGVNDGPPAAPTPTPTFTKTSTSTFTATATNTRTPTRTNTPAPSNTPTATRTLTATRTNTNTFTPTKTKTPAPSNTPTATRTLIATATPLTAPTVNFPASGGSAATARPLFDWANVSGATSYTLQISTDATFTNLVLNINLSPSAYVLQSDLPPNTLLFWRARANGPKGPGPWSRTRHFYSADPPGIPALLLPADGATASTPVLDWSDSTPAATYYEVQIAASADFAGVLGRGRGGRVETSTYTPQVSLAPGIYYWRVRAVGSSSAGLQFSGWSAARRFRVP